ncbi:MAG: Fe2+-dependent dioxygenase [Gammaproteobacteria bacterium]|nr:Fe2+-dependent dioxygenase [Gammaproteobacteria bacterium]
MLITIDEVLTPGEVKSVRDRLERSTWAGGEITAGLQAARAKNNRQLPEDAEHLPALRTLVLTALQRNALFFTAALPARILPPFFNCYEGDGQYYGDHVDGAMRALPEGGYLRADVSATLFLSEPEEYEGGVLTIEDTFGHREIKLRAGDMVVYPSSSVHQVTPVTRGRRLACFMFIQSMIRDAGKRRLLFDMDMALLQLRQSDGETAPLVRLTGVYHNLLRHWAEN